MYYYIYDQFLSHKKYDKTLAQIESKLTDLDIKNRIIKMSILKSVKELVLDAIRKGAQTIVVAGNNQTVNQIVNVIAGRDVVLGIIPIENNNSIANFLGIDNPLEACEIIAARKIEKLNLGEINENNYFLNELSIRNDDLYIKCDNKYYVNNLHKNNLIKVYNFCQDLKPIIENKKFFNPQDNFLEVTVEPDTKHGINSFLKPILGKKNENSLDGLFRVKQIKVQSKSENNNFVEVDGAKKLKTPLSIRVSDKKINVIVGKNRKF